MIRTRFAPSPTGFLHLGSARTALYAWLYARKMGGQMVLRIEDTDLERSTPEAVRAFLEAMEWLGLDADEGPYYQTQRLEHYQAAAAQLVASGQAYHCHCSLERLEALRAAQGAAQQKPRYDGHCRDRHLGPIPGASVIRFCNPTEGSVCVDDAVHGPVSFNNAEIDDLVLVRSNGMPTYNFTVVVDDWAMKISHVIRGDDHLNNTPRQINILKALGAALPIYAHIPMILGPDGKRLSKRHGAVSVQHYQEMGVLPQALRNYLVRLGWSHGDQEIFSLDQMIELFEIRAIHKSAAMFNPEKLLWLNQHYIKDQAASAAEQQLRLQSFQWQLARMGVSDAPWAVAGYPSLAAVYEAQRERAKTLQEMAEKSLYFYQEPIVDATLQASIVAAIGLAPLAALRAALAALPLWEAPSIHQAIDAVAQDLGRKLGDLAKPLRVAVSGGTVSPPIDQTLALIGASRTLARLDRFMAMPS